MSVSQWNTSDSPLPADTSYTGLYEHLHDNEGIAIHVEADQDGTLKVQHSLNATVVDVEESYPITANVDFYKTIPKKGRFILVVYENGAVDQSSFKLRTSYINNAPGVDHSDVLDAANELHTDIKAELMWLNNATNATSAAHSHLQNMAKLDTANAHHTSANTKLDTANALHTDVKAELMYQNNTGTVGAIAHSHLLTHTKLDTANSHHTTAHSKLDTANGLHTDVKAEIQYANNTGASGSLAHSLVNLLAKNTQIETDLARQYTIAGTHGNLMNGLLCALIGTDSTEFDFFLTVAVPKRVTVLVNATTSIAPASAVGFSLYASADGTNWCHVKVDGSYTISLTSTDPAGNGIDTQGGCVTLWSMRYLKIKVFAVGTFTATVVGLA